MSWLITPTERTPLDQDYRNVSLLLHGNGANGSTTIVDNSPSPKTVTAVGNAQISTAQSKFGGASIAFDGSGDFLTIPANNAFDIGSGDCTAELWFYVNANPGSTFGAYRRMLIGNYANSTSGWSLQLGGTSTAYTSIIFGDGDDTIINASVAVSQNVWHHVALAKNGANCRLYFNGSQVGSTASRPTFYSSSTRAFYVGRLNFSGTEAWDFSGFIDDIRITKGVARYTSNFTPPTAPFPDAGPAQ